MFYFLFSRRSSGASCTVTTAQTEPNELEKKQDLNLRVYLRCPLSLSPSRPRCSHWSHGQELLLEGKLGITPGTQPYSEQRGPARAPHPPPAEPDIQIPFSVPPIPPPPPPTRFSKFLALVNHIFFHDLGECDHSAYKLLA